MDNLREEKSVYCTVIRRQPNGICSYLCGAGDGYRIPLARRKFIVIESLPFKNVAR